MYLSSSRNNLCLSLTLVIVNNNELTRLLCPCLNCMHTSTRNSALATIFSIRQPRHSRSSRIHLGILVKDTSSYRDVGTQTDPEPDSSHFVASKSESGVSPLWKSKNTSDVGHHPPPDSDQEEEERELPLEGQEDESEEEGSTESSEEEDEEEDEGGTDESTEGSESSEPELPVDVTDELPIENLYITESTGQNDTTQSREPIEDNETSEQPNIIMSATTNISTFALSASQSKQQSVDKRVKIPDPQPFKGDLKTVRTFIAQLTSKVMGSEFEGNENLRVRYATTLIHGDAAKWLVTFISTDGISYEFTNYIDFVKKFKAQFVDPNPKATAARKLFTLKQGQEDIQTYLTKAIPIAREADLGLVATKEIIKGNLNERSRQYLMLASANLSDETLQSENLVQFKERIRWVIRRMENETSSSAIHAIL